MASHTDSLALRYKNPAHMRIEGGISSCVANTDKPAVARTVSGFRYFPVAGAVYRRAIGSGQIHPFVEYPSLSYRMHPASEFGRYPVTGMPAVKGEQHRIIRQDKDRLPYLSVFRLSLRYRYMPSWPFPEVFRHFPSLSDTRRE